MTGERWPELGDFLQLLHTDEEPMGVFYTKNQPREGFTPGPLDMPNREKEAKNEVDWDTIFGNFSCMMGHIWRARRKKTTAWFSSERFGCPGAAFFTGFMGPQTETIIHYVSTGFPGKMEGEHYVASPDECRSLFHTIDPRPAPAPYLAIKPLSLFAKDESPELVVFFGRPEMIAGLHQLATFITGKAEAVRSPWGAACSGITAWPYHYLRNGEDVAVLGGWDPSARKFYRTDELSFTVSLSMLKRMLERRRDSFLTRHVWSVSQKKIDRSKRAWGESSENP